jgi:hypothetical protein
MDAPEGIFPHGDPSAMFSDTDRSGNHTPRRHSFVTTQAIQPQAHDELQHANLDNTRKTQVWNRQNDWGILENCKSNRE